MKRFIILLCSLALLASCSQQHYTYLQAAEQRESVTPAQREEYKIPLAQEKAEMIPLVYRYIQENQPKGFKIHWTQWKNRRR